MCTCPHQAAGRAEGPAHPRAPAHGAASEKLPGSSVIVGVRRAHCQGATNSPPPLTGLPHSLSSPSLLDPTFSPHPPLPPPLPRSLLPHCWCTMCSMLIGSPMSTSSNDRRGCDRPSALSLTRSLSSLPSLALLPPLSLLPATPHFPHFLCTLHFLPFPRFPSSQQLCSSMLLQHSSLHSSHHLLPRLPRSPFSCIHPRASRAPTLQVRRQLAGVSTMPDWALGEEENVFDLPAFNAYALPYITAVGEYLLTLPQQLEPLAVAASEAAPSLLLQASASGASAGGESATPTAAGEEDAGAYFVREWMTKVADGATSLFVEQIRAIPEVSDRGAQQLAADIEYLCSVLSVLYVAASPAIATFQACFATPKASLAEFIAQESGAGGSLDATTARLVAKMRRVALE
ncbi:unnamed protein product [Closterium sp. NIES-54]